LTGSLPTLLLGNALLVSLNAVNFYPTSSWGIAILVWLTLLIIGLPTVLHIGQSILKDYDKKQLQQARSLGINNILIGNKIIYKSIRKSFNAAVLFAISRILIEGYIVLDKLMDTQAPHIIMIRDVKEFSSVFYKVYAAMTIQQNVFLIFVLFIMAIAVNVWSYGLPLPKAQV
jgi:ABC-type phosphate transport system permease subunit